MEIKPTAIDKAFQKFDTPVGPVYFVERHGNTRRCFSRDTALWHLAKFMTTRAFYRSGFQVRHDDARMVDPANPDIEKWLRGNLTHEYYTARSRCVRRLRRILARKRDMQKWAVRLDELMKQKPY
ncbi:hypothetical protein RU50_005507 [Salmonella enterica subsp. enterica]|nr:hypothetical protein [Salmonella enterica subsp. enterica]